MEGQPYLNIEVYQNYRNEKLVGYCFKPAAGYLLLDQNNELGLAAYVGANYDFKHFNFKAVPKQED